MKYIPFVLLAVWGCDNAGEVPTEEPLVFVFQKQKDPKKIESHAQRVAQTLSRDIGREVKVMVPASYGASVQALVSNRAQVAYLSSIPFLLARQEAGVEELLVELRDDQIYYNSIFVVRADSSIKELADVRGKRMMFTSPTSTSGYVMAYSRLVDDKLLKPKEDPSALFSEVRFAGGYDRALLAVLNGQADVCAVSDYTMVGPKADLYLTPEQRGQLRVLARTPGVPTHMIAARTDLSPELRKKIADSLLKMTREQPDLLADVYGAARFVAAKEEEHLATAIKALQNTGLDTRALVK